MYNAHFFAQIFEGKIRVHLIYGYNDYIPWVSNYNNGHNNPMYNEHKNVVCIIHGKIRY